MHVEGPVGLHVKVVKMKEQAPTFAPQPASMGRTLTSARQEPELSPNTEARLQEGPEPASLPEEAQVL